VGVPVYHGEYDVLEEGEVIEGRFGRKKAFCE
jgi:hypothetical protein